MIFLHRMPSVPTPHGGSSHATTHPAPIELFAKGVEISDPETGFSENRYTSGTQAVMPEVAACFPALSTSAVGPILSREFLALLRNS